MKYILRNKILLVVFVLVVALFPNIIALPQQSRTENIITAMGIDKNNGEYEVSIQYVIPFADSPSNSLKVMSGKGETVGDAVENMDREYGKNSGFAHCRAVIFNDEACENNLTEILDFLLRIKTNTNDIVLINTKDSAKKLLESVYRLDDEFYTIINSNGIANEQRKYQDLKSIGDYYNAQFGESKALAVSRINLKEEEKDESQNSTQNSSEKSQQGSQSSGQKPSQKIENNGEVAIIKDGKKILSLDKDESKNLAWFDNFIKESSAQVKNFTDETYRNADINFYVYDKNASVNVSFENGEPIYTLNLKVYLRTAQIIENGTRKEVYEINKKEFSPKLKYEIANSIKQELLSAEENFKTYDYDVVHCEELFHKFHPYKYADFKKTLSYFESFISHTAFRYNVEVIQRL